MCQLHKPIFVHNMPGNLSTPFSNIINSVHEKKIANCSICHIELKVENLTRHMKTKHEDNSFECQECNQKFNRRCNLTRHINTVHKKLDMKKCTECAKLYSDKYKLRNHKCKGIKGRQTSMKTKGAQ